MHIYLVRHGQTDDNFKSIVQGRIDNPLNNVGKSQAAQTGNKLKDLNIKFDYIYSSPLIRAKQSAQIINEILNIGDIIVDENLTEREFGNLEGLDVSYMRWLVTRPDFKKVGYETDEEIISRVKKAIDEISKKGENILIVCHSHTIKSLLVYIDKNNYSFDFPLLNAQVVKIRVENGCYNIEEII